MKKKSSRNITFFTINEDLELIIKGLKPQMGQRFLSVCSSGDVPFALSEYGEVVAFDNNPEQIEYAKSRRDELIEKMYNRCFMLNSEANWYLKGRKGSLRPERIEFVYSGGERFSPEGDFDAIYLSNIIGYCGDEDAEKGPILIRCSKFLRPNGIIYVTNGNCIWPRFLSENVPTLSIDVDLTEATNYHDVNSQWYPKVLRRIK